MELQVGVKAFIKNSDNKYLFLKRVHPYHGDTESKWDIPGGRIVAGEALLDALKREVKEETSMVIVGAPKVLAAQDILRDKHVVRITYQVDAEGDIILDPLEHKSFQWVSLEEALLLYHDTFLTPIIKMLLAK